MERYAPNAKDLASRDVVSRAMTIEIREGRGVGEHKDHIHLHLEHLGPEVIHERLPGIAETARIFAGVDVTKAADPGAADRALQHGRHPAATITAKSCARLRGNPDAVVPGLMAVGEAACVSVHGANRLGSNSLLDLVVFGREAAHAAPRRSSRAQPHKPLRQGAGDEARRAPRPAAQRQRRAPDRGDPPRDAAPCSRRRGVPHRRVAAGRRRASSAKSSRRSPTCR